MHKLKEKIMDELHEYEKKAKQNPTGRMSEAELTKVHTLSDTAKNLCKIEMYDSGEGYSEDGGHWMARGNYGGTHGMHGYNDGEALTLEKATTRAVAPTRAADATQSATVWADTPAMTAKATSWRALRI